MHNFKKKTDIQLIRAFRDPRDVIESLWQLTHKRM